MKNSLFTLLLFLSFFLQTEFLQAQISNSIQLSFRLFDKEGKVISPYRFESECLLFSSDVQQGLIHQKRLLFDDRSYYYYYQTENAPNNVEGLILVHAGDTLLLEIQIPTPYQLVLDSLSVGQGHLVITPEDVQVWEGTVRPEQKNKIMRLTALPTERITAAANYNSFTKALRKAVRVRFSNYMEILHSK